MSVLLEHVDEQAPDGFALHFGVRHTFQSAQEQRAFVGMDQRYVVGVAEH